MKDCMAVLNELTTFGRSSIDSGRSQPTRVLEKVRADAPYVGFGVLVGL